MTFSQIDLLKEKLKNKEATVLVIGQGYVGLPLAMEMNKGGYNVIGLDVDEKKVNMLNSGVSYIGDVSDIELKKALDTKKYRAESNPSTIHEADVVCICVPTPLNEQQNPDVSYIEGVTTWLKSFVKPNTLIVLESTTYPGTTEELIADPLKEIGFKIGENLFICFSPERVDPNNQKFNTKNTPKVIGGITETCTEIGMALYENVIDTMVPVSSPKIAEMTKLLENTFRSVNIAFINEMAKMCEIMGISIWEVIDAAKTKPFGFMPFYPGPGIGGHCIPLDPMYLAWKAKEFRFHSRFIELAQETNNNMPFHVSQAVQEILNNYGKALRGSKVVLFGMAYKPNIDDVRESPSLWIYEILKAQGADVSFYDPFIQTFRNGKGELVTGIEWDTEEMKKHDLFIMLTPHDQVDYDAVREMNVPIYDTRYIFKDAKDAHIYRIGDQLWYQENLSNPLHV